MAVFSWCVEGNHALCHRDFEQWYMDAKNKVVRTGKTIKCDCLKRGCKCYTRPADRPKKTTTRRKKK